MDDHSEVHDGEPIEGTAYHSERDEGQGPPPQNAIPRTPNPRILFCLDESSNCMTAFKWLCLYILKEGDELILAHVWTPFCDYRSLHEKYSIECTNLKMEKPINVKFIAARYRTLTTEEALVFLASKYQADTIVTASRCLGTVKRMLIGSASDFILHHSTSDVIIHKATYANTGVSENGARQIVVAVDFSDHSLRAVEWTAKNAKKGDHVTLIHTISKGEPPAADSLREYELVVQRSQATVCSVTLTDIDPREGLVKYVEEHPTNLLVMGRRGLGAIKRMLVGSVSTFCTHHASTSIAVIGQHES